MTQSEGKNSEMTLACSADSLGHYFRVCVLLRQSQACVQIHKSSYIEKLLFSVKKSSMSGVTQRSSQLNSNLYCRQCCWRLSDYRHCMHLAKLRHKDHWTQTKQHSLFNHVPNYSLERERGPRHATIYDFNMGFCTHKLCMCNCHVNVKIQNELLHGWCNNSTPLIMIICQKTNI